MSNLISATELHDRLGEPNLVIVDARFYLGNPQQGRREYEEGHIPGAFYLALEPDLSAPVTEHGGRHPLPDLRLFVSTLERAGISSGSKVVVYDSAAGAIAGRLWWMLKYLGHDEVRVLDGGYDAWLEAGYPVSTEVPLPKTGSLTPKPRPELVADIDEVRRALENPRALLIDARTSERYRGEDEPIDRIAGHIPTAKSYPLAENLEGGRFKPAESLRERYKEAESADEVIVYCGSGVSAAHNLIALSEAGLENAKLYVGSWSDWITYEDSPIATGDDS
jgi:thiosulfate/3-mercaptopyruvate sulfurtransferase